jgi:hypothetical protein
MTRKLRTQAEMEADARRRAHEDGDPLMLIGPDILRFARDLISHDHGIFEDGYQFWREAGGWLSDQATMPERPGMQVGGWASRFNSAVTAAYGYVKMSPASDEVKLDLLRRYFPPPREGSV